jgi:hypothetical protein
MLMFKTILGTVAVIIFAITKFTGVELSNVGTTSIDAVAVNRPVAETYKAFAEGSTLQSDLGQLSDAPQITVSREPNRSITYRISSTIDSDGTMIKINFGDTGATGSTISAEIDVADVHQGNKYVSEDKVRKMLSDDINDIAYALNNHNINEAKLKDINSVLISLAALTNATTEKDADTLVQRIAEKSFFEQDNDPSPASTESSPVQSASNFGAPTGITGAPSAPLPSNGDSNNSYGNEAAYKPNYGNPTTTFGSDNEQSIKSVD